MTIRALFCDLDGTLVETKDANFLAYREALANSGIELGRETFLETWGQDSRVFLPNLFPQLSQSELDSIRESKANLYPKFLHMTTLNIALSKLLELQKRNGIVLGLVTTAKASNATGILEFHKITELFDFLVTGDDVSSSKPDPECYLQALEKASVFPNNAITFEDTETGIAAAENAGIRSIRISLGGSE